MNLLQEDNLWSEEINDFSDIIFCIVRLEHIPSIYYF